MNPVTLGQKIDALRAGFPVLQPGHVWLVGAGPGDPGLLTLQALAALDAADVVVHDALVDPRVLALARNGAIVERAGKRGGAPSMPQDEISRRLIALARAGKIMRDVLPPEFFAPDFSLNRELASLAADLDAKDGR